MNTFKRSECLQSAANYKKLILLNSTDLLVVHVSNAKESIYLTSTVINVDMMPIENKLRGVLCEGPRPFPDFSFRISDSLW